MKRWNRQTNLTSVKQADWIIRHYCESLFFGTSFPEEGAFRVADFGSGAGFPGIPLAVLWPGWSVTLIESNQRKAVFLRESTRGIKNIYVIAKRGDEVSEDYDWVVSRAVNPDTVIQNVPRLASRVGLMLSEVDFLQIKKNQEIAWGEPIRLPWGEQRICVFGEFHVERST
jgi:16S rRNA (guanine527-N7)-methyltransferase